MFTLIEADRSKSPFARAAVPSDVSAFSWGGGGSGSKPDLIFQEIYTANVPPLDQVALLGICWEGCGGHGAGKSPAAPRIQIYFDFCSDQPQMFF